METWHKDTIEIVDFLIENSKLIDSYSDSIGDYLFGSIREAKYKYGNVIILDGIQKKVNLISIDSGVVKNIGHFGRGPGEYIRPEAIAIFDSDLVVMDAGLSRLSRYQIDLTNNEYTHQNSAHHNMIMRSLCINDDGTIWLYGMKEDYLLHVISNDLKSVEYSFLKISDVENMVVSFLSQSGIITCSGRYIFIGNTVSNEIKIFNTKSGHIENKIVIPEIMAIEVMQMTHQGVVGIGQRRPRGNAYNEKGDYFDSLENLISFDNYIIAQYLRRYEKAELPKIISVVINAELNKYSIINNKPLLKNISKDGVMILVDESFISMEVLELSLID